MWLREKRIRALRRRPGDGARLSVRGGEPDRNDGSAGFLQGGDKLLSMGGRREEDKMAATGAAQRDAKRVIAAADVLQMLDPRVGHAGANPLPRLPASIHKGSQQPKVAVFQRAPHGCDVLPDLIQRFLHHGAAFEQAAFQLPHCRGRVVGHIRRAQHKGGCQIGSHGARQVEGFGPDLIARRKFDVRDAAQGGGQMRLAAGSSEVHTLDLEGKTRDVGGVSG